MGGPDEPERILQMGKREQKKNEKAGDREPREESSALRSNILTMQVVSGLGRSYLCLNIGLNLGKRDWTVVIVVHPYIVLRREKHLKARVVQTRD